MVLLVEVIALMGPPVHLGGLVTGHTFLLYFALGRSHSANVARVEGLICAQIGTLDGRKLFGRGLFIRVECVGERNQRSVSLLPDGRVKVHVMHI